MASEYLKQKYKDVKPDAPRELTEKEKRQNWWHYHKWHVVGGIAGVLFAAGLIWDIVGPGDPKPDYQAAYIGTTALPEETVAALETGLASLGEDLNGDGEVLVRVQQYVSDPVGGDPSVTAIVEVQLIADLSECESYLFLLEDPAQFQKFYHALCFLDGTMPEEEDDTIDNVVLSWEDCPVLSGMDLGDFTYDLMGSVYSGVGQDVMSRLYVARRGIGTDMDPEYRDSNQTFWENITKGADF